VTSHEGHALKARNNRLQMSVTYRVNEWRNDQWSDTLESCDSEDQSLWKKTKSVVRVPSFSTFKTAGRTNSQTPRKRKPWSKTLRISFRRWTTRRTRQILRWSMRGCAHTSMHPEVKQNYTALWRSNRPSGFSSLSGIPARKLFWKRSWVTYQSAE
jgi:hypothetical protein